MAKIRRTPEQERISEAIVREFGAETANDTLEAIKGILFVSMDGLTQNS